MNTKTTSRSAFRGKSLISIFAAAALLASIAVVAQSANAQQSSSEASEPAFTLTILHNNDGESKLLPNEESGFPGIARFVTAMKNLKTASAGAEITSLCSAGEAAFECSPASATVDGVITLTSGDNFLASKEFNTSISRNEADGSRYYDAIALSGIYDALALGNHDFDFGPDVTATFINGFDPAVPFLSANIDYSEEPALVAAAENGRLAKSTVIEYGDVSVGVIGAVTPQLPNISSPRNVVVSDVLEAVNAEAARLEGDGVNIIILVSHLQSVNEDLDLIATESGDGPQLSGVDIVIAGGGDELLSNDDSTCLPDEQAFGNYPMSRNDADGNPVYVITAPGGYRCIGQLTAGFDADGKAIGVTGRSIAVALDETPDADVQSSVVEPLQAALSELEANVIAQSAVDLNGVRASVRTGETNVGNLMADATLWNARRLAEAYGAPAAHVGLQNGGGIRNDSVIPAGDVTMSDTFDMAPFSNFIVVLEVPRETFHVMLEQAVDGLPGARGQFAQLAGVKIVIDPSADAREIDREGDCSLTGNAGSRVISATLDDGTEIVKDGAVVPGDPVVLATINFLANGGDCYPLGDIEATSLGLTYQASLAQYITDELDGQITADAYPADGEGRIVQMASEEPSTAPSVEGRTG